MEWLSIETNHMKNLQPAIRVVPLPDEEIVGSKQRIDPAPH